MTRRICIDIALLPPAAETQRIIALTSHLAAGPTRLNTHDCLPHMTLAMGVLASDDLGKAREELKFVGAFHEPVRIRIRRTRQYSIPTGVIFSELTVEPSAELERLYQGIREKMGPLL